MATESMKGRADSCSYSENPTQHGLAEIQNTHHSLTRPPRGCARHCWARLPGKDEGDMVSAPQVQDGQWGAGSKRQSGLDVRGRGSFAGIEDPAVTTLKLKCCGEHSGVRPAAAGRQLTPQHAPLRTMGPQSSAASLCAVGCLLHAPHGRASHWHR